MKREKRSSETTNFSLEKLLGKGSFSNVYSCANGTVAVKHIEVGKTSVKMLETELNILKLFSSQLNFPKYFGARRHPTGVSLFMESFEHQKFVSWFRSACLCEIKDYIQNLLLALSALHKHNIIHRDVKPSNFMYDRSRKRYALIDFGLAEHICHDSSLCGENCPVCTKLTAKGQSETSAKKHSTHHRSSTLKDANGIVKCVSDKPAKRKLDMATTDLNKGASKAKRPRLLQPVSTPTENSKKVGATEWLTTHVVGRPVVCVCSFCRQRPKLKGNSCGTAGFKAPEVLLALKHQSTSADIWAVGVILLCFLSRRYPFFYTKQPSDQIEVYQQLVTLLGTKRMQRGLVGSGWSVTTNPHMNGYDLPVLCKKLRDNGVLSEDVKICQSCSWDSKSLRPCSAAIYFQYAKRLNWFYDMDKLDYRTRFPNIYTGRYDEEPPKAIPGYTGHIPGSKMFFGNQVNKIKKGPTENLQDIRYEGAREKEIQEYRRQASLDRFDRDGYNRYGYGGRDRHDISRGHDHRPYGINDAPPLEGYTGIRRPFNHRMRETYWEEAVDRPRNSEDRQRLETFRRYEDGYSSGYRNHPGRLRSLDDAPPADGYTGHRPKWRQQLLDGNDTRMRSLNGRPTSGAVRFRRSNSAHAQFDRRF